jgi:hypothetical protein
VHGETSVRTAFNRSEDFLLLPRLFFSFVVSMGNGICSWGATKAVSLDLSALNATINGLFAVDLQVENFVLNPSGVQEAELETLTIPMPSCIITRLWKCTRTFSLPKHCKQKICI